MMFSERGDLMNNMDTGNSPDTIRVNPVHVQINTAQPERVREREPETKTQSERQHDEYIQLAVPVQRSALYDVSDVRRERVNYIRNQIQEKKYRPNGEIIAEKIVDVILPPGIKNLRIFRKE